MPTTIAGYYIDELADWIRLIRFYNQEIIEFGKKMGEVIRRNTIPNIAEKVEVHQAKLNNAAGIFNRLYNHILRQQAALQVDHKLVENSLIDAETERRQNELRQQMEEAEKAFVKIKYACYQFLSETLKKQQ